MFVRAVAALAVVASLVAVCLAAPSGPVQWTNTACDKEMTATLTDVTGDDTLGTVPNVWTITITALDGDDMNEVLNWESEIIPSSSVFTFPAGDIKFCADVTYMLEMGSYTDFMGFMIPSDDTAVISPASVTIGAPSVGDVPTFEFELVVPADVAKLDIKFVDGKGRPTFDLEWVVLTVPGGNTRALDVHLGGPTDFVLTDPLVFGDYVAMFVNDGEVVAYQPHVYQISDSLFTTESPAGDTILVELVLSWTIGGQVKIDFGSSVVDGAQLTVTMFDTRGCDAGCDTTTDGDGYFAFDPLVLTYDARELEGTEVLLVIEGQSFTWTHDLTTKPALAVFTVEASSFSVSGRLYADDNDNGQYDALEELPSGVQLFVKHNTAEITISPDDEGLFTIGPLPAFDDDCVVEILGLDPNDFDTAIIDIVVDACRGEGDFVVDIVPTYLLGSVSGQVFLDVDDPSDGQVDGPAEGFDVSLDRDVTNTGLVEVGTTQTNAAGEFLFENLRPGTYSLGLDLQPAFFVNGDTDLDLSIVFDDLNYAAAPWDVFMLCQPISCGTAAPVCGATVDDGCGGVIDCPCTGDDGEVEVCDSVCASDTCDGGPCDECIDGSCDVFVVDDVSVTIPSPAGATSIGSVTITFTGNKALPTAFRTSITDGTGRFENPNSNSGYGFLGLTFVVETRDGSDWVYEEGHPIVMTVPIDPELGDNVELMLYDTEAGRWSGADKTCNNGDYLNDRGAGTLTIHVCHLTQFALYVGNQQCGFDNNTLKGVVVGDQCACFSGYAAFNTTPSAFQLCNLEANPVCFQTHGGSGGGIEPYMLSNQATDGGRLTLSLAVPIVEDRVVHEIQIGSLCTLDELSPLAYPSWAGYWKKELVTAGYCVDNFISSIPPNQLTSCGIDPVVVSSSIDTTADDGSRRDVQVATWWLYNIDVTVLYTDQVLVQGSGGTSFDTRESTAVIRVELYVPKDIILSINLEVTSDHNLEFLLVGQSWIGDFEPSSLNGYARIDLRTSVRWPYDITVMTVEETPAGISRVEVVEDGLPDSDCPQMLPVGAGPPYPSCIQQFVIEIYPEEVCKVDGNYVLNVGLRCRDGGVSPSGEACTTDTASFVVMGIRGTDVCAVAFADTSFGIQPQLRTYEDETYAATKDAFFLGERVWAETFVTSSTFPIESVETIYLVAFESDAEVPNPIALDFDYTVNVDQGACNALTCAHRFATVLVANAFPQLSQGETLGYTFQVTAEVGYDDGSRRRAATRLPGVRRDQTRADGATLVSGTNLMIGYDAEALAKSLGNGSETGATAAGLAPGTVVGVAAGVVVVALVVGIVAWMFVSKRGADSTKVTTAANADGKATAAASSSSSLSSVVSRGTTTTNTTATVASSTSRRRRKAAAAATSSASSASASTDSASSASSQSPSISSFGLRVLEGGALRSA